MAAKIYPRPNGGPEPTAQGPSDNIPLSNHSLQPEGGIYDYRSSVMGASLDRNAENRMSKISDAKSDPMDQDKASPKPRT